MVQRRNTRQRRLVLDAVMQLDDHPTADEIYLTVRQQDEHVSRGTVYRNLNLLAEEGRILDVKVPGGDRFDHRVDDHAHLVCRSCGEVCDVPDPNASDADARTADATGYAGVSHYTVFSGICPKCQEKGLGEQEA
jgi:Fe2+ or Zn2+ uptake regulation protein